MEQVKTAIVAGHVCLDITPVFPRSGVKPEDVLSPGHLTQADGVNIHVGGAVANTGLAMKLLGASVRLVGKIGADDFGTLILRELEACDAAAYMIVDPDTRTSYSVVLAIPGVDRMFIHDPGANDSFTSSDIDSGVLEGASLFHFGYPPLMSSMYRNDGEDLVHMLRSVKNAGVPVSLDMAAVDPATEAGAADWEAILRRVLPYVDFFVPSAEEICWMIDRERYREWIDRSRNSDVCESLTQAEIKPLAEHILDMGANVALIKCGAAGLYCETASTECMSPLCRALGLTRNAWVEQQIFEPSFVPDAVVSGTGAGDTSIAAFLVSVLQGESLQEALQAAAAAGAFCVEAHDALSGLRAMPEMKQRIQSGWAKRACAWS